MHWRKGATTAPGSRNAGWRRGSSRSSANELASRFDTLESVRIRVGALPQYPSNALNYNLTWSTDGVINEYFEPCEAIVEGELREAPAMEELEEFSLDGTAMRLSTPRVVLAPWAKPLKARFARSLPDDPLSGHGAIMSALLNDLGLATAAKC